MSGTIEMARRRTRVVGSKLREVEVADAEEAALLLGADPRAFRRGRLKGSRKARSGPFAPFLRNPTPGSTPGPAGSGVA